MRKLCLILGFIAFALNINAQDSSVECSATLNGEPITIISHVWEGQEGYISYSEWKSIEYEVIYEYVATDMEDALGDNEFMKAMLDLDYLTYNQNNGETYFSKSNLLIDELESPYDKAWDFIFIEIDINDNITDRYKVEIRIGTCKLINGMNLSTGEKF